MNSVTLCEKFFIEHGFNPSSPKTQKNGSKNDKKQPKTWAKFNIYVEKFSM